MGGVESEAVKVIKGLVLLLAAPVIVPEFFSSDTGREYKIGRWRKLRLLFRIAFNRLRVPTASHLFEHLVMAAQIMRIPAGLFGCIVECGTFKGGSAVTLSLVADLCGRELHIFDSFAGLPPVVGPQADTYKAGDWCGTLQEVKKNLDHYGRPKVCTLHPGFFSSSLPMFSEPCVLAFVDVDLVQSLSDCLKYLWPQMQPGCHFFIHEARDPNMYRVFFDQSWWRDNIGAAAPGLIGAGTGVGLFPIGTGFGSCLAFATK